MMGRFQRESLQSLIKDDVNDFEGPGPNGIIPGLKGDLGSTSD